MVQRIVVNGTTVNQYFFETICVRSLVYEEDEIFGTTFRRNEEEQASECKGIDKMVSEREREHVVSSQAMHGKPPSAMSIANSLSLALSLDSIAEMELRLPRGLDLDVCSGRKY